MTDTLVPNTKVEVFPATAVEAALRQELLAAAKSAAELEGVSFPADPKTQAATSIQIDSLVVVQTLVAAETPLGFELKDHVVRAGGYTSVGEALGHLMPRIEKEWTKRKGKGGKS
jgi:hypothetical protein